MHLCQENWMAKRRLVMYYAWAAHVFSASIKYRHSMTTNLVVYSILHRNVHNTQHPSNSHL